MICFRVKAFGKKDLIFQFLFLIVSFLGFSQVKVDIGIPYGVQNAHYREYLKVDNGILSVKVLGRSALIQKFDAGTLAETERQEYVDFPGNFTYEGLIEFAGQCYFFYSAYDKKMNTEQLFFREIDFATGKFVGDAKIALQVNVKIRGKCYLTDFFATDFSISVSNKYNICLSSDKSKLLVSYSLNPEKEANRKSYEITGIHLFGKGMKPIWDKQFEMSRTEANMKLVDHSLDNDGNVYALTAVYNSEEDVQIEILKLTPSENPTLFSRVELKDHLNTLQFVETSSEDISVVGYYNNGKGRWNVEGVYFLKVSKDGKGNIKKFEMPPMNDLKLTELKEDSDGGIVVIGEQRYTGRHGVASNRNSYPIDYYNHVHVAKISKSGDLMWMNRLAKRQVGSTLQQMSCSYKYLKLGKFHYVIYIDNLKNISLAEKGKPNETYYDRQPGNVMAYKISDEDGKVEKLLIQDLTEVNGKNVEQFKVNRIVPVSSNEFIFEVYKGKKEDVWLKALVAQ
jgi:hypothetical protein